MTDTGDQRNTRREYVAHPLTRANLDPDPWAQLDGWLREAADAGAIDATAMALATATLDGVPSVRIVLMKHFDRDGLCWYTDSRSSKGVELAANPVASGVFYWRDFNRQVRVTGPVEVLPAHVSDAYFDSRPLESRLSAAASEQSAEVADRPTLERRVAELRRRYPSGRIPRPDHWRGYRLQPRSFEFWQGREGRLHDRFHFEQEAGGWRIVRLQP